MTRITKLGRYLIRRELGKGAMGIVYEGFDPVIERTVAIKTILPGRLDSSEAAEVLARFKREAQSAGRLNHPGIVAVYEYGEVVPEDDSTLVIKDSTLAVDGKAPTPGPPGGELVAYIAMEFVKGRELKDYFDANERFKLPEVARLMGEILSALGHAHSHGVVHRDIKPANLIVLEDGRIKIADFGIARIERSELTQMGTIMGTPAYMSPEQFTGQAVDGRSDLFSCGIVLYQFLTGEKPFTGNTTTIMFKVLREEPLAPSVLNMGLPTALDDVLKKAIAKIPDQRFQSAAEFNLALQAALNQPPPASAEATLHRVNAVAAPASGVAAPLPSPPAQQATVAPAPPSPVARAEAKSNRTFVLALLAGALVVAGLGAFLWASRPDSPPPAATATPTPAAPPAASAVAPAQVVPMAPATAPVAASPSLTVSPAASAPPAVVGSPAPVEGKTAPPLAKPASAPGKATSAVRSASEPASRPVPAALPRVRASAQESAPTVAPAPAPKPPAHPSGPTSPKEACAGRVFLSLAFCMQSQCNSDQFKNHPQCVEMRKLQEEAAERRKNER